MSTQDNIRTVQEIYEAFRRGDVNAILARFADQGFDRFGIVNDEPAEVPWYMTITKKADVPKFFEALAKECDFKKFEPHDFAASGDDVYCTVDFDIVLRRNGRALHNHDSMHHFRFKDGRVVAWSGTEDTAKTIAALHSG